MLNPGDGPPSNPTGAASPSLAAGLVKRRAFSGLGRFLASYFSGNLFLTSGTFGAPLLESIGIGWLLDGFWSLIRRRFSR
jgi:hypothetical protein